MEEIDPLNGEDNNIFGSDNIVELQVNSDATWFPYCVTLISNSSTLLTDISQMIADYADLFPDTGYYLYCKLLKSDSFDMPDAPPCNVEKNSKTTKLIQFAENGICHNPSIPYSPRTRLYFRLTNKSMNDALKTSSLGKSIKNKTFIQSNYGIRNHCEIPNNNIISFGDLQFDIQNSRLFFHACIVNQSQ